MVFPCKASRCIKCGKVWYSDCIRYMCIKCELKPHMDELIKKAKEKENKDADSKPSI